MHKFLSLCLLVIAINTELPAQPAVRNNTATHEYYIRLSGINSRQDVENLQNIISKKKGIRFFMANRYPVRFFLMRSDHVITAAEFAHFLDNISASIEFYGEGEKGREQAILVYNKLKARQ